MKHVLVALCILLGGMSTVFANTALASISSERHSPLTAIIDGYVYEEVADARALIPLPDIIVQAWDSYPDGSVVETDTTDSSGYYHFSTLTDGETYDLRAHSQEPTFAYFPSIHPDLTAPGSADDFVLQPTPTVIATNQFAQFYCDGGALFQDYPLQPGDVVLAFDPQGVLCGKSILSSPGSYSMFVYGDDPFTPDVDEGARDGNTIRFTINDLPAQVTSGSPIWGDFHLEEVCLRSSTESTISIPLSADGAGWNLISWNVDPANDSTAVIFNEVLDNVTVILGFENDGGAFSYRPTLPPAFSDLFVTSHMRGYWVKVSQDDTLHVTGAPVFPQTPYPMSTGWHLLSYLPFLPDSTHHAIESVYDQTSVVLGFDNGALSFRPGLEIFSDLKIMQPGAGYWFRIEDAPDTLIYPPTQVPIALRQDQHEPIAFSADRDGDCEFVDITPTNQWMDVYGQNLTFNGAPLPIGTIIKALDDDGVICGIDSVEIAGQFGLMPVYADDPNSDEDEGVEPGQSFSLEICHPTLDIDTVVETGIEWSFGALHEVHFDILATEPTDIEALPSRFALKPNYPNPFNPSTTIHFEVPIPSIVTLDIYNAAGQLVRTVLNDDPYPAGRYAVRWNADNQFGQAVGSGVYFYRLRAKSPTGDDFEATRRMILLR